MDREWNDKFYRRLGNAGGGWRDKAAQLRFSAGVIQECFNELVVEGRRRATNADRSIQELGLLHSSMLLLGFAAENLIKAVLVANDPTRVKDGELKKWPGGGHDLLKLIALPPCDTIELSDAERHLLVRLGESILWAGRYPIPLRAETYHQSQVESRVSLISTDFDVADGLFTRLDDLLHRVLKSKPIPWDED
jgi:hypothetical protein